MQKQMLVVFLGTLIVWIAFLLVRAVARIRSMLCVDIWLPKRAPFNPFKKDERYM